MSRTAVYPGTFDPITNGHLDIIKRAMHVTDKLIIGVAENNSKQPVFSLEERVAMAKKEVEALGAETAARIEVTSFSGLLVEFARSAKASVFIRGLRAASDFEYEFQMAGMNSRLAPEIDTVFLPASESTHFVSSRFAKRIASLGGDVSSLVSDKVALELADKFTENKHWYE